MSQPVLDQPDRGAAFGGAFQPSARSDDHVRLMVQLLDLQDSAPPIRRLRDWALSAAEVGVGEVVVDVGSGTGTMARELGSLVSPGGRVVGVEPNPRLRAIAEERAEHAGVEFVDGLAGGLPMTDASVDLIWCERVLQHVPDPQAAIADFARVLRPGGRALLLDSDHATRITSDIDHAVEAEINNAFIRQVLNPRAARLIPRHALEAGLTVDPDVGSAGLVMPNQALLDGQWLRMAAELAVADGAISQDAADRAVDAVAAAARAGYAFSAVTVFGFVVRKPGS